MKKKIVEIKRLFLTAAWILLNNGAEMDVYYLFIMLFSF